MADFFPYEILTQILKRLPIKSLLRCRSVQKSWYHLIHSPRFIISHLDYQKTHNKYLLFDSIYSTSLSLRFDDLQCPEYYRLERLPGMPEDGIWYASSNGLICLSTLFFDYNSKIYLWNPAIRKLKTLPDPPSCLVRTGTHIWWVALAFGFGSEENDFKVVKIVNYGTYKRRSALVEVYSLSTNCWKEISNDNLITFDDVDSFDSVFVNGTAFFRGKTFDKVEIILGYDTRNDAMRKLPLPQESEVRPYHYSLQEFGESLAFYGKNLDCSNGFNMWVLKEGSTTVEAFWEKKISVNLGNNLDWAVLGLRNNGEIILRKLYEWRLVSYNIEKNEVNNFVDSWDQWSFLTLDSQSDPFGDDPPPFTVNPFVEGLFLIDDAYKDQRGHATANKVLKNEGWRCQANEG